MGTIANPLSGLIDGLLKGHELASQLHRQQLEDQAFKTNQALHEQNMSVQDIMNRQMLQEHARPISDMGTVDSPAVDAPSPLEQIPGMPAAPDNPALPAYHRKADASRTVKYGGKSYELKTPEEQQQAAIDRQVKGQDALEIAKGEGQQRVRESVLKMRGVPVPAELAADLKMSPGTLVLPEEIPGLAEHVRAMHKPENVAPGGSLVDPVSGKVIAQGGPPNPTGEFATVYLPKFAASLNKKPEALSLDELQTALGQFKQANADPEVREATIAGKNAANATRDLANVMKQVQMGQMPTKEDAARLAESIRNHELAPSQLSEIRGRGNGQLGLMIEREMSKSDPHFNWQQADADYNYSKSPGLQNTVRLMDSALNSIPRMQQAANKLAMGGVRSVNSLVKLGKNQFNDIDLKRFQTDATLVGDEIGKIIQGGGTGSGVSDAKLVQAQSLLKDTDSPKAIATALEEVNAIIGYRRQAVTRGTYLEGRQAPTEGGAAGGKIVVTAPDGSAHPFNTQAEADKFKALAGIK